MEQAKNHERPALTPYDEDGEMAEWLQMTIRDMQEGGDAKFIDSSFDEKAGLLFLNFEIDLSKP